MDNEQPKQLPATVPPQDQQVLMLPFIDNNTLFEMNLINMVRLDILQEILVEAKITSHEELAKQMHAGLLRLTDKLKTEKLKFNDAMQDMIKKAREEKLSHILEHVKPHGSA